MTHDALSETVSQLDSPTLLLPLLFRVMIRCLLCLRRWTTSSTNQYDMKSSAPYLLMFRFADGIAVKPHESSDTLWALNGFNSAYRVALIITMHPLLTL
jgi:hypothetical protein